MIDACVVAVVQSPKTLCLHMWRHPDVSSLLENEEKRFVRRFHYMWRNPGVKCKERAQSLFHNFFQELCQTFHHLTSQMKCEVVLVKTKTQTLTKFLLLSHEKLLQKKLHHKMLYQTKS